ncbi:hypothetical protein [Ammonifex thiophilus]|uniref:Methionine synthase n=1 Tax=Ammonifex thiophilus TaxID=444093 RepID=A0A3D8P4X9_9THEO|nr:hypothetical protein [Ammonifex thiophilus]RDV84293.1 hypothetical protein DXX99_03015 [Ammonifex thiophilus]
MLHGYATGIGSLPYREVEPALKLIARHFPLFPHWPQLPRRTPAEGFVTQFLSGLKVHGVLGEGEKPSFLNQAEDWPDRLTRFYTFYLGAEEGSEEALATFIPPREAISGFYAFQEAVERGEFDRARAFKGQIVGPLTAGFQLTDAAGRPAYYDLELRELILRTLQLAARWQARELKRWGRPVAIFIDEPGVSIYGQSTYITVTREQIMADMGVLVATLKEEGVYVGVHSCAAVDWSLLLDLPIDILSFDAYGYFSSLFPFRRELAAFLKRGGVLAWGIVPTSEKAWEEDLSSLRRRLEEDWAQLVDKGIPEKVLREQWLITPSCGTGLLPEDLAERIYTLTSILAASLGG